MFTFVLCHVYFCLNEFVSRECKFGRWPQMPNNSNCEGLPRLVHLGYATRVFRIAPRLPRRLRFTGP